jgi:Arc/MetJ-type ribon-helix-helix transcriptional regulator
MENEKTDSTSPLVKKVVRIHQNQQEMLDTFTGKWGFVSESEVIRAAIVFMYKKWEPEYLQPSSKEKKAKDLQKKAASVENMPDLEFATNVIKGVIKYDQSGKAWVLSHAIGNSLYCTPLSEIRTWAKADNGFFVNYNHGELAKGKKIEDVWPRVKLDLMARYKLVDDVLQEVATAVPEVPVEVEIPAIAEMNERMEALSSKLLDEIPD